MVDLAKPAYLHMLDYAQEHGLVVEAFFRVKIQDVEVTLSTEEIAALRLALIVGLYTTSNNNRHGLVFKARRPFKLVGSEFGQQITYDRCAILFSKKDSRIRVKFRLIPKTVELVGTIGVISLVNKLGRILSPLGKLDIEPSAVSISEPIRVNYNIIDRVIINDANVLVWLNNKYWMQESDRIVLKFGGDTESSRPDWVQELHSINFIPEGL